MLLKVQLRTLGRFVEPFSVYVISNEWGKPFVLRFSIRDGLSGLSVCFSTSGCKVIMNVFQRAAVFCIGQSGYTWENVRTPFRVFCRFVSQYISSNNIGMTAPVETRYPAL